MFENLARILQFNLFKSVKNSFLLTKDQPFKSGWFFV